jgi:branched-chain amino acid transport system substrate-binding protein
LIAVLAMMAAGCSSSSSHAKASTTATTGGAASASDIVVEGVASLSSFPGLSSGFQARITRANSHGGIAGRKIRYLGVQDDGGDPTKNLTIVQSEILKDHVFAVAPVDSLGLGAQSADFMAQNHTPFVGDGINVPWCSTQWGFAFDGCYENPKVQPTSGVEEVIKASGMPASQLRVAIEGLNLQGADVSSNALAKVWTNSGATVVFNQNQIPYGSSSDYTPYVQAIVASKANVVFEELDLASAIRLTGALHAAGYKGVTYDGVSYLPGQLAKQPDVESALQGDLITLRVPAQEDQTPAIKQEEADLQASGASTEIQLGTALGYWAADLLVQMLEATAAKGDVTPDNLQKMVTAGFTAKPEMRGGNGPVVFPENLNSAVPCNSLVQVSGDHYVSKVPWTCFKNIQVG